MTGHIGKDMPRRYNSQIAKRNLHYYRYFAKIFVVEYFKKKIITSIRDV
jgi:hypothetical protein